MVTLKRVRLEHGWDKFKWAWFIRIWLGKYTFLQFAYLRTPGACRVVSFTRGRRYDGTSWGDIFDISSVRLGARPLLYFGIMPWSSWISEEDLNSV